ncbi:MAG: GAF domain-containing protein [Gemmatimonadales bacterium]|nr:GAF domain-containing protein [Gemmatimonadales bacterium]NIN12311.1 GAF domain-containing protein [Gemmatimonadales bacterium]NIN48849.1 GAF domain-containing protein [Gemmatimonadales bacterium]NIP06313.1 GAF domain-containing protein [Gemmatimonadales bacterium]NIR00685.1 GAF domain-containing protein [Gemmatimonadales bacterium]
MKYVLLHPASLDLDPIAPALEAEAVDARQVTPADGLSVADVPTTLVLDSASRSAFPAAQLRTFVSAGGAIVAIGAPDEKDAPTALPDDLISAFVPQPFGTRHLLVALRTAYREAAARAESSRARQEAAYRAREIKELTRIGMALSTERDYDALLELILSQALELTASDAASLYLVETPEDQPRRLRFKLSQTTSRPDIPLVEYTMPLDTTSIAGCAATTGEPLVIDDVYFLPPDVDYTFNRSIDERYGYRSKSMLTIPMKDHKDTVIGVLQLINRKRHGDAKLTSPEDFDAEVIPYTHRLVELVSAMAGQAAVSIENSQLYEGIERLFEGFVRASVYAIEQRDPTTFGHSGRVASMTVALAEAVDRTREGPYRHVGYSREELREIRYAGLLHDFGKVGVREQVLVKAKKLPPSDLALIKQRFAFIRRTQESEFHRQRAQYLERNGRQGYEEFLRRLEADYRTQIEELDRFMRLVLESNEPTVLPEGSFESLRRYASRYFEDLDGKSQPYLTGDEVRFLSIRKGSLDQSEREEIESHVTHTYRFLMQIPWTPELRSVPDIAFGHHEKLDGSGYPRRVGAERIPIQTRMMTIADIFDALTASDRPYKHAVPVPRALDILRDETEAGMLDPALLRLFSEAKAFQKAAESEEAS